MSSESSTPLIDILAKRKEILKKLRDRRKVLQRIVEIRTSRPEFLRNIWWKFKKFQNNLKWKKPRGKDNPMRLSLKGYPPKVSVGYRTPADFRDVHPYGLKPVVVNNVEELKKLNPKEHLVYISSTVGLKKKLQIVSTARSMGFKVANG